MIFFSTTGKGILNTSILYTSLDFSYYISFYFTYLIISLLGSVFLEHEDLELEGWFMHYL